jgi:molybdopterin-guanine dinucleotide biosynthesis protein MobB
MRHEPGLCKAVPTICFVGPSGSGKTTLLAALIPHLTARGIRVAAVKQTHHVVENDLVGKDSWRLREAGATEVLLVTPLRTIHTRATQETASLDSVLEHLSPDVGLVLAEGYLSSCFPKVLIGETVAQARSRGMNGEVVAVLGAPADGCVPGLGLDDVEGLGALITGIFRLD